MSDFAINAAAILAFLIILCAATSLILTWWRTGGLKQDAKVAKHNVKKIVRQIHEDITLTHSIY